MRGRGNAEKDNDGKEEKTADFGGEREKNEAAGCWADGSDAR